MAAAPRRVGRIRRNSGYVQGVTNAVSTWRDRVGLLLWVEEDGWIGLGEASPLPGYSPDTLDEAEAELTRWTLAGCPDDTATLTSPSARFAAETVLLDLEGQRQGIPMWRLLGGPDDPAPIPVAGLITSGDEDQVLLEAESHYDAGVRTFKLKVGPDVEGVRRRLEALRRRFGDRVTLRLDANRSLDLDLAVLALAAWAEFGIEFIEEPSADLQGLHESPIPLALDESLQVDDTALSSVPSSAVSSALSFGASWNLAVLVLKPTVLGLTRCLDLARQAAASRVDVVVSHTFEGPVALQACAHLALALGSTRACGLGRHGGLDAWPGTEGLLVTESRLDPLLRTGTGLGLTAEALL